MHDLDEINVAIRLGDRVVPPVGAVCKFGSGGRHWRVEAPGRARSLKATKRNTRGWMWYISARDLEKIIVLEIPDDAPPFSEWTRVH